ncbi:helix-turn-helix transcriptional regulator [Lactobacillus helveticus]|uniref:helix-turn-helix domain-containing protein n=2 Tax=Lactobacillus helveticus TaxID=1587 RepID=UPI001561D78A|nr:helix-turn-helix transcriptional regulator [Lactobacillus helveticus]NRO29857.1 hypothetical protein [Lactobacillus helveticus]
MNIGNQLKNIRVFLGLTQEQFCAGIVTESFYSRVENNRSNISMEDLVEILNFHHISLYDFFISVDVKYLKKKIIQAFLEHDVSRLSEYKKLINSSEYDLEFKLMFAILNSTTDQLTNEFKEKAQRQLLQIGKLNEDSLFNINLLIPIIDFQSSQVLVNYLLKSDEIQEDNCLLIRLFYNAMLSFLGRCYQEPDIAEMKKGLKFLRKRSVTSSLYLENNLVNCYEYLLKRNYVKLDDTVEALKLCGYKKFVVNFEELISII